MFVPFSEFYKPEYWSHKSLRRQLDTCSQRYLDTLEVLRAALGRRPESYYIPGDSYLSAEGNAVIAETLDRFRKAEP